MEKRMKNKTIVPITNDYVFCKVLERNPEEIAKVIVEIVLGTKIKSVNLIKQKVIDPTTSSKKVRFDVYLEDSETIYDVEMQTSSYKNLVTRARYYLSANDVDWLESGNDYLKLPNSFIIFICTFDPFKKGQIKYVASEKIFDSLGDDITKDVGYDAKYSKIYLNTKGIVDVKNSQDLINLLAYFNDNIPKDEFTKLIDKKVKEVNKTDREAIMEYLDHDKDIRQDEAYTNAIILAKKMLKNNEPLDKILSYTGLAEEEIKKIMNDKKLNKCS